VRTKRKFICSVLILFLVNSVFSAFTPEVLADAAFHQDEVMSLAGFSIGSDSTDSDSSKGQKACNHGCHAYSHVQGQVSYELNLVAPDTNFVAQLIEDSPRLSNFPSPQFRPPKLPS
jgi:hypothetical protein